MAESGNWEIVVPEATRNLVSNPSFELDALGWGTGGSNNLTRVADESFKGDYSLEMEYQDSLTLASYVITLTAEAHTFSARVFIPAGWDGGAILLAISGFTSATIQTASGNVSESGRWIEIFTTFTPDAGDLTGNLLVQAASAPSAGAKVYLDGVQCEAKAYATTYCDGDQEGCSWDGKAQTSQSRRLASSRAGGVVRDMEDYFGFRVQRWPGTGMGSVDNISTERVVLPGAEWQRARLTSRTFVLSGTLVGESPEDLMDKREALVTALSPFGYDGGPVIFRFRGREIRARYAGGMDLDKVIWRYEQLNLPFLATEPRWLSEGQPENSEALETGTVTTRLILGKIDGVWSECGPPAAPGTAVYTSIRDIKAGPDGLIYVCGVFQNFNNIAAADYIARYNPLTDTWSAVGTPSSGATITSILKMVFAPNGDLYVVGNFTNLAGNGDADYIARYTAAGSWTNVGGPNTGGAAITSVQAVAYGFGNRLWVGGTFSNLAGIAAADNIAYWDISAGSWNAAGVSGADIVVRDIWAAQFIDQVYATGEFTTIDGVSADRVAVRELGTWMALGSGLDFPGNRVMVTGSGVYVGGQFGSAGQITSESVAFWSGEKWQAMGGGVNEPVYALAQMATGEIVVGGEFTLINTVLGSSPVPAKGVGYWNGSVWNPPEFLLPGTVTVYAAEGLDNGDLYLGFDQVGDTEVPAATTITNVGTAPAWPVFVLSQTGGAPSSLVQIENATTGKKLTFSYALAPGVILWIDLRPGTLGMYHTAPKAAVARGSAGGSSFLKSQVGAAGSGRFFRFGPDSDLADFHLAAGDNLINLYFQEGSGAVITAYVRWVDAFESVD